MDRIPSVGILINYLLQSQCIVWKLPTANFLPVSVLFAALELEQGAFPSATTQGFTVGLEQTPPAAMASLRRVEDPPSTQ